jgi:hypothetical protein
MIELYQIATDPKASLEERYAAIKIMKLKQREAPGNYLRTWKRREASKRRADHVRRQLKQHRGGRGA